MARPLASRVTIENGAFRINGTPTYAGRSWRGHRIEGLLFNSRMANAIADDENPATRGAWAYADGDWDAERSTREFIAALPSYRAHGLLGVCLNLQGGSPQGYSWHQPWKICGFNPDGTIKPAWAARLNSVIKTYPDVSQFWTYDRAEFLKNPVYSRDYPPAKNLEP